MDFYGSKNAIHWSVKVRSGSAVIEAIPEPTGDPKIKQSLVSKSFITGLRVIEEGVKRPPHFSEKALEKINSLAKLTETTGLRIYIFSENDKQQVSPKAKSNIDELLKCTHSAIGTIEGELQILAKRQGFEIEIQDEVSGRLVHCSIPQEMLEDAKEAFARRVAATGTIHYRADGTPVNIEVEELFRFPLNRELPNHNDVRGIFGGLN
jgi:hypothetical protein